ncbi:protein flightless-1 homolog isoform X2 [Xenia sp. Carnegie-2017]|uniref:protein flightless-1 homolog isoform X2 n=1 Tax=Xenia sp. Carnegie-2017 TaxID=2897299 RepID=UPI001F0440C5|nr:protein flightless-1 homolog isoform X2 [Xenia sp. Carnegie-2017]
MAAGILPFVRGVDFSQNDFEDKSFPERVGNMPNLRWLKLDKTKLHELPDEISHLKKLEHLSVKKNQLNSLHNGDLTALSNLKVINARKNQLKNSGIPNGVFSLEELLTVVPEELENAHSLCVLSLANNRIENIPNQLFINCTDLMYLDLSDNQLDSLPPQLRRLVNLQVLILNNNPLMHAQLRQLPNLMALHTLHLRNTQRTITNMPNKLDSLTKLTDVDLSYNDLPRVPEPIYRLSSLKRLNLSHNSISELSNLTGTWTEMEVLNISRNQLTSLPSALCKLVNLRKLYISGNNINFEGIPTGVSKLYKLEIFAAACNKLECIPEGLCRCLKLKKLILHSNCLVTLPEAIHFLPNMKELDVHNNPNLTMPPKPSAHQIGSGAEYYNVDFTLETQLRLAAGASHVDQATKQMMKDPTQRKMRLRGRRYHDNSGEDSEPRDLKGMVRDAEEKKHKGKSKRALKMGDSMDSEAEEAPKKTNWLSELKRPNLNYEAFFPDNIGQEEGLVIWHIENFVPVQLEDEFHGKFYTGDCYIVLKTEYDDTDQLVWDIYFWVGAVAALDSKACAAIHSVNLRNFLGSENRIIREEQSDESEEFLDLFDESLRYIQGGSGSGFYTVEETVYVTRLYRLVGSGIVHLEPVPLTYKSLDPRYSFLLDTGMKIYVWSGEKSKLTDHTKGRLFSEKINKNDRKNRAEIFVYEKDEEPDADFWACLGGKPSKITEVESYDDFKTMQPIIYKVGLGHGYLELPQVEFHGKKLTKSILETSGVYIVDCHTEIFTWLGRKSPRLVRAAALKLAQEMRNMISRPDEAIVSRNLEKTESWIFKSKFHGWNDVLQVDFTRTAESVANKRKLPVAKPKNSNEVELTEQIAKVDLTALFTQRQAPMPDSEVEQLVEEWNEDLDGMECFVLEGKKFTRLPEEEIGHFYSGTCYVFLCRYFVPVEMSGDEEDEENDHEEQEEDFQCVVYFWEGRDAGNMGWLIFTFSLQKKFEALFGEKLEVVRTPQQREAPRFLAHFKGRFIIHKGKRNPKIPEGEKPKPELFHIRANGGNIYKRAIQIPADPKLLNSEFSYILKVPFDNDSGGIVYVWNGSKVNDADASHATDTGQEIWDDTTSVQAIREGAEPENFFWVALGGKSDYDKSADYMRTCRLFRCSNEQGYFKVSEKCSDFCQDDLADDDCMILDSGDEIFLWFGNQSSHVERKLTFKSAQVYIQYLYEHKVGNPRKLRFTQKGQEPHEFTRCFHGWSDFHNPRA